MTEDAKKLIEFAGFAFETGGNLLMQDGAGISKTNMKTIIFSTILTLLFFAFGCGTISKFTATAGANSNVGKLTPPPPTVAPVQETTPDKTPPPFDKASLGTNYLAFGAGTVVVAKTSEAASSDDSARKLNDESGFGWQSAKGAIENQSVTLELPSRTTFKTFVFDTKQTTSVDGRAAKDVIVEISEVSATSGFQTILEATLKDEPNPSFRIGINNQRFPVQKEIAGRFVR